MIHHTIIGLKGRRIEDMIDAVKDFVAVIAESRTIATAHIGIGKLLRKQLMGV